MRFLEQNRPCLLALERQMGMVRRALRDWGRNNALTGRVRILYALLVSGSFQSDIATLSWWTSNAAQSTGVSRNLDCVCAFCVHYQGEQGSTTLVSSIESNKGNYGHAF